MPEYFRRCSLAPELIVNHGNIIIKPSLEDLAFVAAQQFAALANDSIAARGQFTVALSGGSTPLTLHKVLSENYRDRIDWRHVHFFWGDERNVPPDHQDSNFRMANETLLQPLKIPAPQIHRVRAELDAANAAEKYDLYLREFFGSKLPGFDLVLLGMGSDGHTASLFPGVAALHEEILNVVSVWVGKLYTHRITLTARMINRAGTVHFLVSGNDKAVAIKGVLEGPDVPDQLPAQLIKPESGNLTWFLDADAASKLQNSPQRSQSTLKE